jgi:hypothetical protein
MKIAALSNKRIDFFHKDEFGVSLFLANGSRSGLLEVIREAGETVRIKDIPINPKDHSYDIESYDFKLKCGKLEKWILDLNKHELDRKVLCYGLNPFRLFETILSPYAMDKYILRDIVDGRLKCDGLIPMFAIEKVLSEICRIIADGFIYSSDGT